MLKPNRSGFGDEAFERWLGHEVRALMKRDPRDLSLLILLPEKDTEAWWTRKRILTRSWICWHFDLRLPASRPLRSKCLLLISHPIHDILLQQLERTDPDIFHLPLLCINNPIVFHIQGQSLQPAQELPSLLFPCMRHPKRPGGSLYWPVAVPSSKSTSPWGSKPSRAGEVEIMEAGCKTFVLEWLG